MSCTRICSLAIYYLYLHRDRVASRFLRPRASFREPRDRLSRAAGKISHGADREQRQRRRPDRAWQRVDRVQPADVAAKKLEEHLLGEEFPH
jgi:hypothetical protein